MNYLVDTHIFLWTLFSPQKISKKIKKILIDPEQVKCISLITFWEISLKYSIGKLKLPGTLPDQLPIIAKESNFELLELNFDTASSFYKLPKLNKDPFDRMLAWQAINKDCLLLTKDSGFTDYEKFGLKIIS